MHALPAPALPAAGHAVVADSPPTATRLIDGADVHTGDVVLFLGVLHRLTHVEPYIGTLADQSRS